MPMPKKRDLDCCVAALEDAKENEEKQAGLPEADDEEDYPSPDISPFLGHLWDHFEVILGLLSPQSGTRPALDFEVSDYETSDS